MECNSTNVSAILLGSWKNSLRVLEWGAEKIFEATRDEVIGDRNE
jgi:hypothetical protein